MPVFVVVVFLSFLCKPAALLLLRCKQTNKQVVLLVVNRVRHLYSSNGLSGTLPESWSNLVSLRSLYVLCVRPGMA